MSEKIFEDVYEDSVLGNFQEDSGSVSKYSGECYQRFCGIFRKIPRNIWEDSRRLLKITGNVQEDSCESEFPFISWWRFISWFISNADVKTLQNNGKSNYCAILLKKTFSTLLLKLIFWA